MKKLILMIAFVTGLGAIANAQTKAHKTPQQKADAVGKKLQTELKLTADQSAKVNGILLAQATRIDSLKANKDKSDKKQNHKAHKAILQETDKKLSAVFTAEQQKTYTALKAAQKEKAKNKKGDKSTE